jgi:hypothetical protein
MANAQAFQGRLRFELLDSSSFRESHERHKFGVLVLSQKLLSFTQLLHAAVNGRLQLIGCQSLKRCDRG